MQVCCRCLQLDVIRAFIMEISMMTAREDIRLQDREPYPLIAKQGSCKYIPKRLGSLYLGSRRESGP